MDLRTSAVSNARALATRGADDGRFRGLAVAAGLLAATLILAAGPAAAGPIAGVHQYAGLAMSPDGSQVAAIESFETDRSDAPHPAVVLRNAADGKVSARLDPCPACRYADPAWSPDGKSLAFVGWDATARKSWTWIVRGAAAVPSSAFDGLLAKPRYAPDGKTLAVLATERPLKEAGGVVAGRPRLGDQDTPTDERRIAVLDPDFKAFRLVSPADRYVYEFDWTPDGRGFVATDAVGDADNNWFVAKLEAVDLATGAARLIATPKTQIASPRISPDGKSVAYLGGLMDDSLDVGGDIWTVPFAGGEPRNLTPGFKGTFNSLQWRAGRLYATAVVFDRFTLFAMQKDATLRSLWSDQVALAAGDARVSLSGDGRKMATVLQSFALAPRIVAGPPNDLRPITFENRDVVSNADARSISWTNEGLTMQAWLLAPKGVQPGKTYPLGVYVHGGPAHFQEPRFQWDSDVHALLDRGYFVLVPNYRGSFGQGQALTTAAVMNLGLGDLRDILASVDAVEKLAPVDDKRLAIFGHSHGGFLTVWAVTQTNRFKAAVASAGVSNYSSYYGENGVDRWMDAFFRGATYYDHPELFDRISPVRFVQQVKTPTLMYVGELDVECPPGQMIEFWHALKAMGVPTSLVIYPGEGHRVADPAHTQDSVARTVAWFDKYVPGGPQ